MNKDVMEQVKAYVEAHRAEIVQKYEECINLKDFWRDAADVNAVGEWLKKNLKQKAWFVNWSS